MNSGLQIAILVIGLANIILLVLLLRRRAVVDVDLLRPQFTSVLDECRRVESSVREDFARQREEMGKGSAAVRQELGARIDAGLENLLKGQGEAQRLLEERLSNLRSTLEKSLGAFGEANDIRLGRLRQELNDGSTQARTETKQGFVDFQGVVRTALSDSASAQEKQLKDFTTRLDALSQTLATELEKIRVSVESRLNDLQAKNEAKLEQMRNTVDEKLQGTLNSRLGEHFKIVSERLELVHKGLGEMQAMATSVGDLKRVLTNVKTRGTWGEIQLGALLEQILVPDQFAANVSVRPGTAERVEFAIRLPGRAENDKQVWLPIDAKFPHEDYARLVEASERGDVDGVAEAGKALETRVKSQAREIRDKYIAPPHTTDFGILFLPSESLYAEVLRRPGLCELLQQDHRVVVAGPTTLAALLNSLQMGFRTLSIQKRSSEVWNILSGVKDEFGKFGGVLDKVKKKLDEASNQIEQTQVRTRAITRKLKAVEALPESDGPRLVTDSLLSAEDEQEEPGEGALPLLDK